ncbi:hypothetical protein MUB18_06660 [Sphingobacterium sp. PCS056]|uniref:hypothetical protein n=1 Tax=Sphingobacterium TaxID=28453 RepID=UPI00200C07E7|nr:hypothetical protein [Sphingobacterium sp. PCS056]UPZ37978.1 hypothetical protein MUB18_06660 [Sphingobacterium sp. PCS056]
MMIKIIKKTGAYLSFALLFFHILTSCKKDDYINDGGIHQAKVNMTTYDFLASHPKFDSLVRIIDRANLKELVNSDITFYATTNWGVAEYVSAKKQQRIAEVGDENISFTIDDIDPKRLDSLKIYMFKGKVERDKLDINGAYFTNLFGPINGVRFQLGLRRTRDYSSYVDYVDYLYYTKVNGTLDSEEPNPNAIPEAQRDARVDVQTSGIITTTGIIHVLHGGHRLFFNKEKMAAN